MSPTPVTSAAGIPALPPPVVIDDGDLLAQIIASEAPIMEKLLNAGITLGLSQVPFGTLALEFFGRT